MDRECLFPGDGRGEDSPDMSMRDRLYASFLERSQEVVQALEVLDEAWEACLDRDIPLDAIVAGSLLRVLNELAVVGGRSAVSPLSLDGRRSATPTSTRTVPPIRTSGSPATARR